jgi:hypothetical protein
MPVRVGYFFGGPGGVSGMGWPAAAGLACSSFTSF